jgi:ABC-type Na+ efflux pump permease subunit
MRKEDARQHAFIVVKCLYCAWLDLLRRRFWDREKVTRHKKRRNPTWSIFRSLLSFLWSSKQKGWYFLSYHHNVFIPVGFLTSSSLTESFSCSKAIESSSTTNFLCLSIIYFLFCIRPQRRPHFEICTCWSLLPFTSYEYNTRYYDLPCTSQFRIIL